jgi:hypothetical protein
MKNNLEKVIKIMGTEELVKLAEQEYENKAGFSTVKKIGLGLLSRITFNTSIEKIIEYKIKSLYYKDYSNSNLDKNLYLENIEKVVKSNIPKQVKYKTLSSFVETISNDALILTESSSSSSVGSFPAKTITSSAIYYSSEKMIKKLSKTKEFIDKVLALFDNNEAKELFDNTHIKKNYLKIIAQLTHEHKFPHKGDYKTYTRTITAAMRH